jgi:hypothetical protein
VWRNRNERASARSFSLSEKHLIFVAADVFKAGLQKLSGVLNIIGDSGAIFVVIFKLYW